MVMMMIDTEIDTDLLNSRIAKNANKYLLLFPNRQILEWYKRYLLRKDIIYMTVYDASPRNLAGHRYVAWDYIDKLYPIIGKDND